MTLGVSLAAIRMRLASVQREQHIDASLAEIFWRASIVLLFSAAPARLGSRREVAISFAGAFNEMTGCRY